MIRITKAGPHPGERKGGNRKSPYGLLHKGFKFLVRLKRFELLAYRFVVHAASVVRINVYLY